MDRLLRADVLVDLYRVVRQGIRVGVESYSIKKLEPLYGLVREIELKDARLARSSSSSGGWSSETRRPSTDGPADPPGRSRTTTATTWCPRWPCATGWSCSAPSCSVSRQRRLPRPAADPEHGSDETVAERTETSSSSWSS